MVLGQISERNRGLGQMLTTKAEHKKKKKIKTIAPQDFSNSFRAFARSSAVISESCREESRRTVKVLFPGVNLVTANSIPFFWADSSC